MTIGCTTSTPKQITTAPEGETYFSVEPNPKTRVTTYHVQPEGFSPTLQTEFEQTVANLEGKCLYWAVLSYRETVVEKGPDYCVKFVKFTNTDLLKPYKRKATDKKMILTALDQEGSIQVQNFVWDGKKLHRIRNSNSKLQNEDDRHDRLAKFMMLWALK